MLRMLCGEIRKYNGVLKGGKENVMALLGVNNAFEKTLCVVGTFFKRYCVMRNISVRRYGKI